MFKICEAMILPHALFTFQKLRLITSACSRDFSHKAFLGSRISCLDTSLFATALPVKLVHDFYRLSDVATEEFSH